MRTKRFSSLASLLAVLLVSATAALGAAIGVASPASAAVQVPRGCGQPSVSSTGHSIAMTCTSGHGGRYKITASACDSHHCVSLGSNVVRYGTRATISSGGYFTNSSARVYWYPTSGGSACLYSLKGGTVPWCDMRASILDWVSRHPTYDGSWPTNWYGDNKYRADCSGFVSMAWHLSQSDSPNTDQLMGSTYTKAVARQDLRPGDILDDVQHAWSNHHVVIFEGWNAGHHAGTTDGSFRVWSFGYGTLADDAGHHVTNAVFKAGATLRGKPVYDYTPRRFVRGAP